jgi:hypothetical protein
MESNDARLPTGRLCVVFRFLTGLVLARTTNSAPEPGDRMSVRELSSSDWLLSQGLAVCWRSNLHLNNRDFGRHLLRCADRFTDLSAASTHSLRETAIAACSKLLHHRTAACRPLNSNRRLACCSEGSNSLPPHSPQKRRLHYLTDGNRDCCHVKCPHLSAFRQPLLEVHHSRHAVLKLPTTRLSLYPTKLP